LDAPDRPDDDARPDGADLSDVDRDAVARATTVSRRRALVNSAANYTGFVIATLVAIFLQGYAIRTLGETQYALWPLVMTCTSIFLIIPLSISMAASRYLARALGEHRLDDVKRITTSVFAALLLVAVGYAAAVVVVSIFFERIFDIPPGVAGIGPWAMLLGGLAIAVRIPFSIFRGGLQATQNFVVLSVIESIFAILRATLIVTAFVSFDPSLIWYGAALLVAEAGLSAAVFLAARKHVPWQRLQRGAFDRGLLRQVGLFSFWMVVGMVASRLFWETDNIIVNKLIDPVALTGYAAVTVIILQCQGIAALGTSVLFPSATVLYARNDLAGIVSMVRRANRVVVPIAAPLLFFLAIFGREVLSGYIGARFADYARIFVVLAVPMAVSMTQTGSGSIPQACGRVAAPAVGSMIAALVNIALSLYFVLVMDLGVVGVALGTAVVAIVYRSVFWPWYVARLLKTSWPKYFTETLIVPLLHCVPVTVLLLLCRYIGLGRRLSGLAAVFGGAAILHTAYLIRIGLAPEDRLAARETIAGWFGRKPQA